MGLRFPPLLPFGLVLHQCASGALQLPGAGPSWWSVVFAADRIVAAARAKAGADSVAEAEAKAEDEEATGRNPLVLREIRRLQKTDKEGKRARLLVQCCEDMCRPQKIHSQQSPKDAVFTAGLSSSLKRCTLPSSPRVCSGRFAATSPHHCT